MSAAHGTLPDLNDLYFFAEVVEHGGFSAASRAIDVPKSRLSKRVSQLEDGLGIRLLQRTTRKFVVTEAGERFYRHCQAMLAEARAATEDAISLGGEPRGLVRLSCPVSLTQSLLAPLLPAFLAQYPQVQLRVFSSNRRVDVIGEGFDVAIRVRDKLDSDAELVARSFGPKRVVLVASPGFLAEHGEPRTPQELATLPVLSIFEHEGEQTWELYDRACAKTTVAVRPRLVTGEFRVLIEAAVQGVGIAWVPESSCAEELRSGRLRVVLPDWGLPQGILHFVYPSRRGMLPAVRALVDFLADAFEHRADELMHGGAPPRATIDGSAI
ncbi:MAG TPA: LysR substrate-binding domain-containing protein [Rhodanobacteraceae bacterium]|nr:LysR substrate-binding domain-containing protein [Rhodanobacteraceae bacterium]